MKKIVAMLLSLVMLMCMTGGLASASDREPLTIEMYNVAANYQGIQGGWYGKLIKDKFNIELNIIAPQVAGDASALYQTRTASGNLGDIVVLDNADLQDCISVGLISDITEEVKNSENLSQYYEQYEFFNSMLENNEEGKIYGLPCQISNTSPTTYSEPEVYVSPMLHWDYFTEIGAPEMENLDDLLDAMEQILANHPTTEDGPVYGFSLWKDWDNTSAETVNQLTKWYGQEVRESVLLGKDGSMMPLTDDNGAYLKMTKFFFDANQRGLLDPDSGTQNWDMVVTKMTQRRVLLIWYSWQRGFWNSPERGQQRENYIYAPVNDLDIYQPSDPYYGDGRAFAIGSGVEGEKRERIIEFMDWLASPEGIEYLHIGIPGFNYTVGDDGKYTMTNEGLVAFSENPEVPEEWGGGGWNDGNHKINQWTLHGFSINPKTGETYANANWESYLEMNKTATTDEWSEKYGADNQVDFLLGTGQLEVIPNVNIILPSDTTDISLIRGQCKQEICDNTWRMIYANDEEEFNQIWENMKTTLDGLGWQEMYEYDVQKYQAIVDARNAALAQ